MCVVMVSALMSNMSNTWSQGAHYVLLMLLKALIYEQHVEPFVYKASSQGAQLAHRMGGTTRNNAPPVHR
jgi:hypothetical protein